MDFLIISFLFWIFDAICPQSTVGPQNAQTDYENGAAFFFSSSHLDGESSREAPPVNEDYDDGPEW